MKSAVPDEEDKDDEEEVDDEEEESLRPSIRTLCFAKFPVDWDNDEGFEVDDPDDITDDPSPSAEDALEVDIDGEEILIFGSEQELPSLRSASSGKLLIQVDLFVI